MTGCVSSSIEDAERPDPAALGIERLLARGMDGEDEADSEQALLASGEPGGELHRVGGGDLDLGIDKPALGGIGCDGPIRGGRVGGEAAQRLGWRGPARRAARRRGVPGWAVSGSSQPWPTSRG